MYQSRFNAYMDGMVWKSNASVFGKGLKLGSERAELVFESIDIYCMHWKQTRRRYL